MSEEQAMERASTRLFLVLVIQLASLVAAVYFIMWTPVYDVVVWNKQILQSLKDGYYNVTYTAVSLTILVYATFYLNSFLGRLEPQSRPLKSKDPTFPARSQGKPASRRVETKTIKSPKVKCPQCGATVYENILTCPFCGWPRP